MGKLTKFLIALNTVDGIVRPGQLLAGAVYVSLSDEMNMRNLRLRLKGMAKVRWSERRGSGKNRHSVTYSSEEVYIHQQVILFGNAEGTTSLPQGDHEFPFEFQLPPSCPTSYEGAYGSIRYSMKATIDKPWKFDHDTKVVFTMLGVQDLNLDPLASKPVEAYHSKTMGALFWKSGELKCTALLPHHGLVPGQSTHLSVTVECTSHRAIEGVKAKLKQHTEFIASRGWSAKSRFTEVTVAELYHEDEIPAGEETTLDFSDLVIPAVPPMLLGCGIINIFYNIKIEVDPCGPHTDLDMTVPVIVGTVPLRQFLYPEAPTAPQYPGADGGGPEGDTEPTAPPYPGPLDSKLYPDIPPPSYEECIQGRNSVDEDSDNEHVQGDREFAPLYPVYPLE